MRELLWLLALEQLEVVTAHLVPFMVRVRLHVPVLLERVARVT